MNKITTVHQNSDGFAKGLLPFVQTVCPTATCRPWNRFEQAETAWLLSPVREWPIYRPTKYYTVMRRAAEPSDSRLLAGIYTEKGYTGDAAKMGKADERMDAGWGWHKVLKGLHSGELPAVFAAMPVAVREQLEIDIGGGYPGDTYGTYRVHMDDGVGNGRLRVDVVKPVPKLAVIAGVESWQKLAAALTAVAAENWLWIDLYIHVRLGLASRTGGADETLLADQQIWGDVLRPMLPWITVK